MLLGLLDLTGHGRVLTIDLQREIPEEMKPRRVEINTSPALTQAKSQQGGASLRAA